MDRGVRVMVRTPGGVYVWIMIRTPGGVYGQIMVRIPGGVYGQRGPDNGPDPWWSL